MDFLHQDIMAFHPFWAATITIITAYMSATGIGWLWARTAQWRLAWQRHQKSLRLYQEHYRAWTELPWFIQWKWTVIQIYQKLTRRRYKQ